MKLKRPAYAKKLLEERGAGKRPIEITLVYGERWWEVEALKICIKPNEYEPGKYDFTVAAGVKVVLYDQDAHVAGTQEERAKLFALVGELARFDAYVEISWAKQVGFDATDARTLAWSERTSDSEKKKMLWPSWWSDELDHKQEARYYLHLQDRAIVSGHLKRSDFARA